jgi:hypothetical protein
MYLLLTFYVMTLCTMWGSTPLQQFTNVFKAGSEAARMINTNAEDHYNSLLHHPHPGTSESRSKGSGNEGIAVGGCRARHRSARPTGERNRSAD